jgi:hypothetical protein
VISVSKDKKGVIKCPKCETEVCIKCNREAHPKKSCDDVLKDVFKDLENVNFNIRRQVIYRSAKSVELWLRRLLDVIT